MNKNDKTNYKLQLRNVDIIKMGRGIKAEEHLKVKWNVKYKNIKTYIEEELYIT